MTLAFWFADWLDGQEISANPDSDDYNENLQNIEEHVMSKPFLEVLGPGSHVIWSSKD
jgi:hypothetical protein